MLPYFGIALLAVLVIATVVVGLVGNPGRQRDFFLAGREAGAGSVAMSLTATCLGASATIGLVGRAYSMGWSAFWWLGSGAVGLGLLGALYVRPMRERVGVRTLPAWMGGCYGRPARSLAALLIVIMWVGVVSAQWVAAGGILGAMLGLSRAGAVALSGTVVILYTMIGGQLSVLRTDALQVGFIAVALLLPHLFLPAAGVSSLPAVQGGMVESGVSLHEWLALVVVVGGMFVVGPDLCSRVLTAKGNRQASRGAWMAAPLLLAASLAVVWLGVRLRHVGIEPEQSRHVFAELLAARGVLPAPLAVVVQVGLLGALLSSADTCLHTAASVAVLDVVPARDGDGAVRDRVRDRAARVAVLLIGIASMAMAHWHPGIIRNMLLAYSFYAGGLLVPLLLMAAPRFARRVPRTIIWTAMVLGGGLPVGILLRSPQTDYAVAGFYGCVLAAAIVLPAGLLRPKERTALRGGSELEDKR